MGNDKSRDVCIIDAVRSPMGKRGGSLSELVTAEIPIQLAEGLFKRNPILYEHAAEFEDVIVGCCSPLGGAALDIGRIVSLGAQKIVDDKKEPLFPVTVPGMHLNRHCASGQTAMMIASAGIAAGYGDLYVAGGVEQQSKYPIGIDAEIAVPVVKIPKYKEDKEHPGLYRKTKKETEYFERKLALPADGVMQNHPTFSSQLISADRIAQTWNLTRKELDEIGYLSQLKATKAMRGGLFKDEIVTINTKTKEKGKFVYDFDEVIRTNIADMGLEAGVAKMGELKTVPGCKFMTAGNSCPTNDGSSLMLLASREKAEELGLKVRAKILSYGIVGSDIYHMLTGPAYAMDKALKRAKVTLKDMDHMEVNEAFSSVTISCGKILADELGHDKSQCDFSAAGEFAEGGRVNPLGGAIALGHPTGASGCRLPTTMLYEMERKKQTYGIASLCVGFGMGTAVVIEREG
ncbi:MAG: thiolase family protein [Candidatus Lokiarchaeota archaeon]|nr:thiolase family protein [Candidatus Lokiarchaeota archaeon]